MARQDDPIPTARLVPKHAADQLAIVRDRARTAGRKVAFVVTKLVLIAIALGGISLLGWLARPKPPDHGEEIREQLRKLGEEGRFRPRAPAPDPWTKPAVRLRSSSSAPDDDVAPATSPTP